MKGPPIGGPFSFLANVMAMTLRWSLSKALNPERSCHMRRTRSLQPLRILSLVLVLLVAATMIACGGQEAAQGEQPMPSKSLEEVLQEHTGGLMAIPGVVRTAHGLCDGKPCIRVFMAGAIRKGLL